MKFYNYQLLLILFLGLGNACIPKKEIAKVSENQNINSNFSLADFDTSAFFSTKENLISNYQESDNRHFDLIHTDLFLSFDYTNQVVLGDAELTLKPFFYPQSELVLDAKDFEFQEVSLTRNKQEIPLNYHYDHKKIKVFLPQTYSRNDTLHVLIKYRAFPNISDKKGSAAITDNKGLYFINPKGDDTNKPVQIWTQGETAHNSKWFPTIDSPNERATQRIRLKVNQKYRTLSNGKMVSSIDHKDGTRTDEWVMNLPHAPYLTALVVGEFEEIKDQWEDIEVNYYLEKEFAKGGAKVFQHTPEMIGFFSKLLGVKYPWQKYDQVVVRDFVSGAMENTTLSIFMEELNLDERAALDSEWDGIIAHELFHQWFGNYVTTESWANLTMNEGFANYSEYLWYEYKNGKDDADLHHISEMEQYFEESLTKRENLVRFYHQDPEDMFDSHSYAKGGRILHMLRRYIGDEAFFASLKHYLEQHAFSSVEVHDLRLAFEKTTGMDLNWFFNQWFLDKGHPDISYSIDYSQPNNLLLTLSQNQDLNENPLYRLPFKVSWYENGIRQERQFELNKKRQQFAIQNEIPITTLYVDEEKELLAKISSSRGKELMLRQFKESQFGVSRYEALDSLSNFELDNEEIAALILSGLKDSFWAVQELAMVRLIRNQKLLKEIDGLENLMLIMALEGGKNSLRSEAIEILAIMDKSKYANNFKGWSQEASYYVAAAAIEAYLSNLENEDRFEFALTFEDVKDIRVAVALASYYIEENIEGKDLWFHKKLQEMNGVSLYYFLGYYGEYFVIDEKREQGKVIQNIYEIGLSHSKNYVRMAAFQALFGFIDTEEVEKMLWQIHHQENDDRNKEIMKMYLEGLEVKN